MPPDTRHARLLATRIYLIVTPRALGPAWEDALEAALATDLVGMVQLREKDADDGAFVDLATRLRRHCDRHGALLILNDRVHLVDTTGADGAHVGEEDLPPEAARAQLGEHGLLGLSTHDAPEVAGARKRGADHVGLGPCFPTATKALARIPRGGLLVARCLPVAGELPVFPIGGIAPENVQDIVAAGASRVAVGAGVLAAADPAAAVRALDRALDATTTA
ncbi:MAG: thiamine phosphate synthase [Planctomycetota bacterium]|jgi:thiamine-phosphate diphosphorylase